MRRLASGSVAWVLPNPDDHRARRLQVALGGMGWEACDPDDRAADARVTVCRDGDDINGLAALVNSRDAPLLVIVAAPDLLAQALRAVREGDDAALADEPPGGLAARLERLVVRARRPEVDRLTGLDDRRAFERHALVLAEPPIESGVQALALLDIDRFKQINDRWGHAVGDQVLAAVGRHLQRASEPSDRCARWGGEEFLFLLQRDSIAQLRAGLEGLLLIDVADVPADVGHCSASIGAVLRSAESDFTTLLQQAEVALYESKARGRRRLTFYEELGPMPSGEDAGHALQLRHFDNVTQVVTQRVASLVSTMGQSLMRALQAEARLDALTRIANRGQFDRRIARETAMAARDGRPLALLFFDIDEFGRFNREHGATVGDAVLRHFAQTLSGGIRAVDWLARYGGEEFCVVMPADADEASAAAERLRHRVESSPLAGDDGRASFVTTSVGVAVWAGAAETVDRWVLRASKALQAAKRAGRNRVAIASGMSPRPEES